MKNFADTVGPRLLAAKDKLMAKGWPCPSIEVGAKVLGKHGLVIWAVGNLAGADNPLKLPWMHGETMEAVLAEIDKAVEEAPTFADEKAKYEDVMTKLSPDQKKLMGSRQYDLERLFYATV